MVVGEGQTSRRGLLRFVLEGDGCQVLAEAATSAELARELAVHRPDIIVLDDGIGATAVGMAKEMVPSAKIVLVWPRAVVPIGGDAQVDPGEVLSDLGPTVTRLAGAAALGLTTVSRPSWMDKNRKDTSTLRDMLNRADQDRDRPNVTELQRRGQRLHPVTPVPPIPVEPAPPAEAQASEAEPVIQDRGTEPLVILPTTGDATATDPDDRTDHRSGAAAVGGAAAVAGAGMSLAEQLAAGKAAEEAAARAAAEGAEPGAAQEGSVEGADVDSSASGSGGKVVPLATAAAAAGAATVASVAGATAAAAAETSGAAGATSQVAAGAAGAAGVAAKSKLLGSIALGGAAAAGALVLAISLGGSRVPTDVAAPTEPPTDGSGGAVIWPGTDGTPGQGPSQGPGQGPGKGPDGGGPGGQGGGNEVPTDAFYPPVPSGADGNGGGGSVVQGSADQGSDGPATTPVTGGGGGSGTSTPPSHAHPEHPLGGPPGQTGTAPGHGGDSPPGSQLQSTGAKGRGSGSHRGSRSGRGAERPAHHHKR